VALKLVSHGPRRPSYAQVAIDLGMSPSEVHAAVKRGQVSHLLHGPELNNRPNSSALEEFLLHGIRYVFPAERGEPTRGMATSYAAEPLRRLIQQTDDLPPVWPHSQGKTRGTAFAPLYRTVPAAAARDRKLYELLALVDALRDGRSRERKLAGKELVQRLRKANAQRQS